uniref:Reverse transcriptase domain-containing protein n=1 Tax=Tanacetum cinerariifolium TaxID=118510 RepID=A0A6L2LBA8_TANCI|nr:reverse transcriptase domain-containing protein [Tanacetum cinerariifolium]
MSTNEQTPLSQPTSAVRNTLGKEQDPQGLDRPASDASLREYCHRNYHRLLPIIAEKVHQENVQQERLKAVKARLNFEETSQHSESGTPRKKRDLKKRLGSRHACGMSGSPEPRRNHFESPRKIDLKRKTVFKRLEKGVFHRLEDKGKKTEIAFEKNHNKRASSRKTKSLSKSEGSAGGHWKSRPKRQKSSVEDDLSQPWEAFLENYLQQKKCIKDPVKIHNIKLRDGECTEEFMQRYKIECRDVKGALECMKILGFMHGITNPELIKRLHDKIPKSVDEVMRVTTAFLRGEGGFRNQQRLERKQDRFTLLTKTPKEILALDKGKFKPPPPMTTPVEKRNASIFREFHEEVGHITNECMHLKRKIKEMFKAGKLGSSSEILYEHCFNRFRSKVRSQMIPAATPLVGFSREIICPLGQISLLMKIEYPEQAIAIGSTLTEEGRNELCGLLRRNLDIFSWKPADMTGVLRHIAERSLNIYEGCLPVRQKKKGQTPKRNKAIYEEVEKLVDAGIMKEVHYHSWLSNPLMAHTIVVIRDQPIKQMLSNPNIAGGLLKWRFKLEEHDIHYRPRTSVKGQILADFIMERLEDDPPDTPMEDKEELSDPWILFTGRSLVANQVNETYVAKKPGMIKYLEKVKNLASTFKQFSIKQVPRWENKKANALSKLASTSFAHLSKQVLIEELKERSIDEREVLVVVEKEGRTWMTLIYEYLTEEILLEEKRKARAIRSKAEAKPVATITGAQIKKFIWDNMVCRFCLPGEILSDNEKQFKDNPLKTGAKNYAHRTMIKTSNGETPFSLTYRTKAVIPVEIGMPTLRTAEVDMIKNDETLEINLDLLEEKTEQATIQEAKSKAMMEKYYNARVRNTSFKAGDLVYRSNEVSHAKKGGKLGPKWEEPYEVTEALGKEAYKLRGHDGSTLSQTWNICILKKCYVHAM